MAPSTIPTTCSSASISFWRAIDGRFKLDRKAQTERLLQAISNRHTTIIGHMTGRQLQRRPGYKIDVEKVLRACAKNDVAVEINAHPWRLDLDWRWHQAALEFRLHDEHQSGRPSIRELDHMHWGVLMARKGGVPADRVVNAMPLAEIMQYLRQKRRSFARATANLAHFGTGSSGNTGVTYSEDGR